MGKIKYYVVNVEQIEELNLNDKEAIVYSIIQGFSQDGTSAYEGGQEELAIASRCSRSTLKRVLSSLKDKGLIYQESIQFGNDRYGVVETGFKMNPRGFKMSEDRVQNEPQYINNINNSSIKENIIKEKRFIPPTKEEVLSYCQERGNNVDPEQFIDFYTSKGWKVGSEKMKDWRAAVRTWEKRYGANQQSSTRCTQPISSAAARMQQHHNEVDAAIVFGVYDSMGE